MGVVKATDPFKRERQCGHPATEGPDGLYCHQHNTVKVDARHHREALLFQQQCYERQHELWGRRFKEALERVVANPVLISQARQLLAQFEKETSHLKPQDH